MSAEDLSPVLRRMLDLWNGVAIDPASVYAPVCSENGTSTFTPDEIAVDIKRLGASLDDLEFAVDGWVADGSWSVLRMTLEGTHARDLETPLGRAAPTGKRLQLTGLEAFQVRDDRIVAVWLSWNWSEAYAALGARVGPSEPEELPAR